MSDYVDLHVHTNHSDGSDAPERVIERAAACGFAAIAIADHDTVSGLDPAERAARRQGIEFLPGVEISASYGRLEVHVVGLGIDAKCVPLLQTLHDLQASRSTRVDRIIERLDERGVPLARAEVEAQARLGSALGRVHVARALHAKGITTTVQQGFDKYMRPGGKAYVPKALMPCRAAIDLIHRAGGVAFIAHPGVGKALAKLLPRLLDLGFDGIEVYHTQHTPGQVTQFTQAALERDLLISGGSDCHGTATKPDPDLGKIRVPYGHYLRIKDALARR